MSYTTTDLVKKHVIAPAIEPLESVALTVQPTGSLWSQLSGGSLHKGSVTVTSVTRISPISETLSFSASSAQSAQFPIALDSVTLASDSSLGEQYIENVDFTIDHNTGAIQAISSGSISSGATVHLWYLPLTSYIEGVDFEIDFSKGAVKRLSTGAIISGQSIQVGFKPVSRALDDAVYAEAVSEANQSVSASVDPDEDFGADLNLQTAATYIASGIVCRVAGTLALATATNKNNAAMWLEMAESFRQDGATALDRFRPPRKRLSGPKTA